jgi:dTDP-4-amino-4,6-dideoxygalactose transaminase
LGNELKELEKEVAEIHDARFAIGVANGTDALFLTMKALGIGEGDEVITTPFTFVSTASTIAHNGARPVFVDIGQDLNIDASQIEQCITTRSKAIVPVHLFGKQADMDTIMGIARRHNLLVIEDSCQAFGTPLVGDAACISFYPTKIVGACGDGGIILTNNSRIDKALRILRNNGSSLDEKYLHIELGFNSRLDEIQAAILREKIKDIPKNFSYDKNRYYPRPLHLQPCFSYLGYKEGDFPIAEQEANRVKKYLKNV